MGTRPKSMVRSEPIIVHGATRRMLTMRASVTMNTTIAVRPGHVQPLLHLRSSYIHFYIAKEGLGCMAYLTVNITLILNDFLMNT